MAQRPDLPAGGPGGLIGIGSGHGPGPSSGARAAVVDGPGPYGDGPGAAADTPDGATAGQALAGYLHDRSADFLRSLRRHRESGPDADGAEEAARELRRAARRISATLYTFRPLTEEAWADQLRAELGWLAGILAREHAGADRRDRLMAALARLTGRDGRPQPAGRATGRGGDRTARGAAATRARAAAPEAAAGADGPDTDGLLSAGAARAAALLDRQLTLARSRAHTAALQALGSARFHALADAVAVLASEVPLARAAGTAPAAGALHPLAENAHRRLAEAVAALPPARAGHAYQADALSAEHSQDAPWHQVRTLVRLSRYAQEVAAPGAADPRLAEAGRALGRHRDAAEAAAAAASAARTPRIAPATAYALGVLHADQRHEVAAARHAFSRLWLPGPAPECRWS
ncbi:CHAD domain-containing protein [Streptomyces sp. NPDC002067]